MRRIGVFLSLLLLCVPASALTIDVFTYAQIPIRMNVNDSPMEVRYFEIDILSRAMDALSHDLKGFTPEHAREEAVKFITAEKQLLQEASQGLKLTHDYKIHAVPAIVFNNGEAVVYGAYDVRSALSLYERWKGSSS